MKTITSYRHFILLILLVLTSFASFSQRVIDPAKTDPSYESKKRIGKLAKTPSPAMQRIAAASTFGCNVDNGCFVPDNNTYDSVPRNDDGSYGPINLPFTFDLYGSQYNQVYINTNGNLTFNTAYSSYVPSGFPFNLPMVAAFWTDVDTRNPASSAIHYQLSPTHLIVTWDSVGYFNSHADKLNTFQIIISALGDPLLGGASNVKFSYKTMQWSVPDGTAGFGPATVGVNKGDGSSFVQIGRFDQLNCNYDGPGGNTDGIGYLENQCFLFNVSTGVGNIPPSYSGFPANDTVVLNVGDTVRLAPQFTGPEVGQHVTTVVNTGGLCGVDTSVTNGTVSTANVQIIGKNCNLGTNQLVFTATDDGLPAQTTTVNLTVIVNPTVVANAPPYFNYSSTPANGTQYNVQAGVPISFSVVAADSTAGDNVTLSAAGIPAGAVLTPNLPASGNPVSATFSWTPGSGDAGRDTLYFTAVDNSGASAVTTVILSVTSGTICDSTFKAHAAGVPTHTVSGGDVHTIYRGYGLQRVALFAVHSGGQAPYTYQWSDGATSYIHVVSPDSTTTYGLTVTDAKGCSVTSSITIYVVDVRCTTTAGNIFICNGGQTMSVPKADVATWLAQGATLGQCNAAVPTTAARMVTGMASLTVKTNAFTVYPNPAKSVVTFALNAPAGSNAKLVITDAQGRVLMTQAFAGATQQVNVSRLASGTYMAKVITSGGTVAVTRFAVDK